MSQKNSKPVIFLAFANEQGGTGHQGYLRKLPEEVRHLQGILGKAEQRGLCELVVRPNATLEQILEVFQSPEYRDRIAVFHYGGHASEAGLYLESDNAGAHEASAEGLAVFLGQQSGLELVFLNGCSTRGQTQGLLDANVSAVIATSQAIDDDVATAFAGHFYGGLAGGATLGAAFNEAEGAVVSDRGADPARLYRHIGGAEAGHVIADEFPWHLFVRPGAETTRNWNLPDAADDPLLGLPELSKMDLPQRPYRQLNYYEEQDAELFFGRGFQIRELYFLMTDPAAPPIVLYCGQSGVGKSSLLNAGLIPRLKHRTPDPHEVRAFRRRRGAGLSLMMRRQLGADSGASLHAAWLELESLGKPVTLIADQVEEVFTRPNPDRPAELDEFLDGLVAVYANRAQRPQGKLILGFRKEWVQDIKRRLEDRKLPHTVRYLESLDRRGIVEAIEGPASTDRLRAQYQLEIEGGLAEMIADDLLEDREAPVAPTLSILLTKMWDQAFRENRKAPKFTIDRYLDLKREGLLLDDFLEKELAGLRKWNPEVVDSGLALDVLAFHTTALGTAERRTRAELDATYSHRADVMEGLLQQSKDRYLLVDGAQEQDGTETEVTRLAHDTLAPLVRQRFKDSDKPGQRAERILENRAVDWQDGKTGVPLDDADLSTVEEGERGMRGRVGPEQRLFEASVEERKIRRRRRVVLLMVLAAMFIAIVAFIYVNFRQGQALIAEGKKTQAEACRVHAAAVTARADAQQDSLLASLLLSSLHNYDEPRHGVQVALGVAQKPIPLTLMSGHGDSVNTVACSPDQTRVVSASSDDTARVWSFGADDEAVALVKHTDRVNGAVFNRNSLYVLTWSDDGDVYRWPAKGGEANLVARIGEPVIKAEFYPRDDRFVMVAAADGSVGIWWTGSLQSARDAGVCCIGPDTGAEACEPVPGEAIEPLGNGDPTCQVRSLDPPLTGFIETAEFSPNGDFLLARDEDYEVRLWSAPDYCELVLRDFLPDFPEGEIREAVLGGSVAGAGTFLALISEHDGVSRVTRWSLGEGGGASSGAERCGFAQRTLQPPTGLDIGKRVIKSARFSPDGQRLVTGYDDGGATYWDVSGDTPTPLDMGQHHEEAVTSVEFSDDGELLATASTDDTAVVWDITSLESGLQALGGEGMAGGDASAPKPSMVLVGHKGNILGTAFCGNDSLLATASADNTVAIWDLERLAEPRLLARQKSAALDVDLNRDGTLVAAAYDCEKGKPCAPALLLDYEKGEPPIKTLGYSRTVDFTDGAGPYEDQVLTVSGDPPKDKDTDIVWSRVQQWPVAAGGPSTVAELKGLSFSSASYGRDGRLMVVAREDDGVDIRDLVDRDVSIGCCDAHGSGNWYAEISPDGRYVATAGRSGFGLGVVPPAGASSQAAPEVQFRERNRTIDKAVFSHDSQYLASAGRRTVRLWSTANGDQIRVFPDNTGKGSGHEDRILSVAFSHDDSLLVSASQDGTARIWNTDGSGESIVLRVDGCKAEDLGCAIKDAVFTPDGSRVVTASADGSVRVWRYRWPDLLEYLEGSTRVRLTDRQRAEFFEEDDDDRAALIRACEDPTRRAPAGTSVGKS